MVMPRSRSSSIESSTWSAISRSVRPPHSWMMRSASVDLPWSMCAMIEKLRMRLCGVMGNAKKGARGTLLSLRALSYRKPGLQGRLVEPPEADLGVRSVRQYRHPVAVAFFERGVGVDVDFAEGDATRTQRLSHVLAQVTVSAPVEAQHFPGPGPGRAAAR
jgi:hypothetical protein